MHTHTLPMVPECQPASQDQLAELTTLIRQLAQPLAVFLLGTTTKAQRTTSIFALSAATLCCTTHYYFLVLLEKESSQSTVQDRLENSLRHRVPATVLVHSTTAFVAWLSKGDPFAVRVLQQAQRLYTSEALLLPALSAVPPPVGDPDAPQRYLPARERVSELLQGAALYQLRQQPAFGFHAPPGHRTGPAHDGNPLYRLPPHHSQPG